MKVTYENKGFNTMDGTACNIVSLLKFNAKDPTSILSVIASHISKRSDVSINDN